MKTPSPLSRRSLLRLGCGLGLAGSLPHWAMAGLFPEQGSNILVARANAPLIDMSGMISPYAENDPEPEPVPMEDSGAAPFELGDLPIGEFPEGGITARFVNANTNERLKMDFHLGGGNGGAIQPADRRAVNWFLRDWRRDEMVEMDPRAIQSLALLIAEVQRRGAPSEVRITSGYRSRATNDMLRSQGRKAAKNSLHIKGMAIDLSFPGVPNRGLAKLARDLLPGGIGSYATFVHIDSGPRRSWGQV